METDSEFDHILSSVGGFRHIPSGRTGYIKDGPWHEFDKTNGRGSDGRYPVLDTWFDVIWDDTGERGEVRWSECEDIPMLKRHITDGVRKCHCGAVEIDGVVVHKDAYEHN
jgi:hypothetical protein